MPGRNEQEAWRAFTRPVEQTVGCVDLSARLIERSFRDTGIWLLSSTGPGVRLTSSLRLVFTFQLVPVEVDGQWRMTTRKYDYSIVKGRTAELVFGWHWHPRSRRSPITYPHLHVPSASMYPTRHIPTGRVSIEDVIAFAIRELGAVPTDDGAMGRLQANAEVHRQFRSWG